MSPRAGFYDGGRGWRRLVGTAEASGPCYFLRGALPMSDEPALRALAESPFSLPHLRDGQLAGMAALARGRDVLAVMPTGYGKSAIYQVAALHLHRNTGRPAVVVSPRSTRMV